MKKVTINCFLIVIDLLLVGFFIFYQYNNEDNDLKKMTVKNDNISKSSVLVTNLFKTSNSLEKLSNETVSEEEIELPEKELTEKKLEEKETKSIVTETVEPPAQESEVPTTLSLVDTSKYSINILKGFNLTTSNKTYSLTDEEFNIVAGVIGCEAVNLNDALAVASVILNRADKRSQTPVQVVSAAGQFSCYNKQSIKSYAIEALKDALNGVRNNNYGSFNGWYSKVSDNYIVEGGNRFY